MKLPSVYKSYILRIWQVTHDGETVWRASLQSTATGKRQGFPDLESLFEHLMEADRKPTGEDYRRRLTTKNA